METIMVQVEERKDEDGNATFRYAEFSEEEFQHSRNEGDTIFCEVCEEYFAQMFGATKCYKCSGHKEIK